MNTQKQIENNLQEIKRLAKESEELAKTLTVKDDEDWFPGHIEDYYVPEHYATGHAPSKRGNNNKETTRQHKLLFGITKTKEECEELCRILNLKTEILQKLEKANSENDEEWNNGKYYLEFDPSDEDLNVEEQDCYRPTKHIAKTEQIWRTIIKDCKPFDVAKAMELI